MTNIYVEEKYLNIFIQIWNELTGLFEEKLVESTCVYEIDYITIQS